MTPDTLASILDANPYPGAVVGRFTNAIRLDFDGLTIFYHADGWHVEALHLESLLNEYSAPEAVAAEIRRVLKTVFAIKVGAALSEAENLRSVDPVEYLTDLAAEKMLAILDVAALASARQAEIDRGVKAHAASARDAAELIAGMERDLAAKDTSLKTAHGALNRVCEIIDAPAPACPDDAVEAVKTLLCESEGHNARADRAEATLAEMVKAIDDAGAPKIYTHDDDSQRQIPDPDRIRLLGDQVFAERRERERAVSDRITMSIIIDGAHRDLDERGIPCYAVGVPLSLPARIRAIPR